MIHHLMIILYSYDHFVSLLVVKLNECNFKSGFCGWTSIGENDKWKLSSDKTFTKFPGRFVMNVFLIYCCFNYTHIIYAHN